MREIFSNAEDCYSLAKKLKEQLGNRIDFYGSINTPLPSGKYLSLYGRNNGEYTSFNRNCLPFYFKFAENVFLRIGVGSYSSDNCSLGQKLAALSDFYKILSEEYGEPTVFYTTKADNEGLLTLQWSFINREEDIAKFKSGNYFDDADIDTLIVIGENKTSLEGKELSDKTKEFISSQLGLPFDLLYLVNTDIENFIKYKNNRETTGPQRKLVPNNQK